LQHRLEFGTKVVHFTADVSFREKNQIVSTKIAHSCAFGEGGQKMVFVNIKK